MKILVTGGAGQLGRVLLPLLSGHDVAAPSSRQLDIADLAAVREAVAAARPELLVNCAAWNDVDGAEADPEGALRTNALGPRNLALASAAAGAALVHVSSDYVFDGRSARPYVEFDATHPLSAYGQSKLAGEDAVRTHNDRHYVVRTAWLYSTGRRNFALTMRGLAGRPEVRVVADQVGSPTYAPHLARGIAALIETGAYGTWHMAGQGRASWYELTCALYAALGIETPVVPIRSEEFPRPAPRPSFAPLATLQSPRILLPPWEEGVREFARDLARAR